MAYDYSNYAMVYQGVASRTPPPDVLATFSPTDLAETSWIPQDWPTTYPGVVLGAVWWPIVDASPALGRYQSYTSDETLVADDDNRLVKSIHAVRDWTADEIMTFKQTTTRHIPPGALRFRLADAERLAFELAMLDNPAGTQDERNAAASVRVLDKDLSRPAYVDLNDTNLQARIRKLETLNIIAAGRADEIIWGDIEPGELP